MQWPPLPSGRNIEGPQHEGTRTPTKESPSEASQPSSRLPWLQASDGTLKFMVKGQRIKYTAKDVPGPSGSLERES